MRTGRIIVGLVVVFILAACGGTEPAQDPTVGAQPTPLPAATVQEEQPTEQSTSPLVEFDGEALLQERCTTCHNLDRVERAKKTGEEWDTSVTRMTSKGARLSDDEKAALIEYLAKTYGP